MNRQAKHIDSDYWHGLGAVTHAHAAEAMAETYNWVLVGVTLVGVTIETRDEPTADNPDPPVFRHRVERVVEYRVTPLREDGDE